MHDSPLSDVGPLCNQELPSPLSTHPQEADVMMVPQNPWPDPPVPHPSLQRSTPRSISRSQANKSMLLPRPRPLKQDHASFIRATPPARSHQLQQGHISSSKAKPTPTQALPTSSRPCLIQHRTCLRCHNTTIVMSQ